MEGLLSTGLPCLVVLCYSDFSKLFLMFSDIVIYSGEAPGYKVVRAVALFITTVTALYPVK